MTHNPSTSPLQATLLLSLLSSSFAGATGIEQAYHDATAAARGNAFAATADTPAAVHYNPGGLAWQDEIAVQGTFFGTWSDTEYSGALGNASSTRSFQQTGALFASIPLEQVTLGFGLTTPHGLGIEYADDVAFRDLGYEADLAHLLFNSQIAWKISDTLGVGIGLSLAYNDLSLRQGIIAPGDSFSFEGTGWGLGWTAGVLWRPHEQHSFGLTYRSAIDVDIDGDARTQTVFPAVSDTSVNGETAFNYPQQVVLGYAWRPTERLLFEVNATWTDWTSFDTFRLELPGPDIEQPYDYNPSWVIGGGVSYAATDKLTLNAGYLYGEASVPDSTFNPLVPDSDLHVFSAGLQYQFSSYEVAATYLLGIRESRDVTGSPAAPFSGVSSDGRWETDGHTLLVSLKKTF